MDRRIGFGYGEKNPKPTQSKKHEQKEQPTKHSIGNTHHKPKGNTWAEMSSTFRKCSMK